MRFEGILSSWNDERGFGFITPTQGGEEIFVHVRAFPPGGPRPQVRQALSFELQSGPKGKRAVQVQPIRATRPRPRQRPPRPPWGTATLFAIPAFLVLCGVLAVLWRPPTWFLAVHGLASVIAFIAYAADKAAAEAGRRRTPESTLHLLSLVGGWPGALLAQQLLRHKTAKRHFRQVFWATVLLNVAGFVVLCSPYGRPLWALA